METYGSQCFLVRVLFDSPTLYDFPQNRNYTYSTFRKIEMTTTVQMIQDTPIAKPLFLPRNCLRSHPSLIALVASSGTDTTLNFRIGLMGPTCSIGKPEPQTLSTAFHSRIGTWPSWAKVIRDFPRASNGIVQFSSVAQLCPTLCNPMDCSTPGLPFHHQLLEFTQTHVHWVGDAIQPSHPLSSLLLPPSIFPSIRVFSNESVLRIRRPQYWSFSFRISPSNEYSGLISFSMDWLDLLAILLERGILFLL